MSAFTRTVICKCGSIKLKIAKKSGQVDYICAECGEYVATVYYDEYETVRAKCEKCDSGNFKVLVTKNEEKESLVPYCTECGEEPKLYCVDKTGNEINRNVRELLIIKDSIERLASRIHNLENEVDELKDKFYSYDSTINSISNMTAGYDIIN